MPQTLDYHGGDATRSSRHASRPTVLAIFAIFGCYAFLNLGLLNSRIQELWGAFCLFSFPIGNGTLALIAMATFPIARRFGIKFSDYAFACFAVGFVASGDSTG